MDGAETEDASASAASTGLFGPGVRLAAPVVTRVIGLATSLAQVPPTTTVPEQPTTTVPPTTVPSTTIPETTTTVPPTTVPPTTIPETTTTTVPPTTVPPTTIPETTTTTVPESTTTVPPTTVPPTTTTVPPTTTTPRQTVRGSTCFVYPMTYPIVGESANVSPFGAARDGGARLHAGNDLTAPRMSPVVAVENGFVEKIEYGGYLSGTSIRVRHNDGWSSHYIHLNNDLYGTDDGQGEGVRPGLAVGDRVKRGELIGWVGDSGNAEGTIPHLHFELRNPGGSAVDPEASLKEAKHVKVSFDGPSPAFIDIAGHPQEVMVNLLASAGLANPCGKQSLNFCPNGPVTGRGLRAVIDAWQGEDVRIGRLIPYGVPFDTSHLAETEETAPATGVEAAPEGTILVTDPEAVRPADGAAGRDAQADEKRQIATEAAAPAKVDTGCGQWRLCDSEAVSIEEVAAVIDGVLAWIRSLAEPHPMPRCWIPSGRSPTTVCCPPAPTDPPRCSDSMSAAERSPR